MTARITLRDKYEQKQGRVYLSSIQALVRVLLDQAQRDRAAGLKTSGFVSGYRGSPIGTFDSALWSVPDLLDQHRIRFLPGLNEELAATAVRGTQELDWFGKSCAQGVFSMWYGKGLGVDRAHEAIKLGNLEGTSATGGVLLVAGDDHGGKSSVSSHQSEQVLMAAHVPILAPSGTGDILSYGVFGYALSRFSGLYVSLKCVTDALDLTASIAVPDRNRPFAIPEDFALPPGGLNLRPSVPQIAQEELTVVHRLPAAQAFARANRIDRVVVDTGAPRLVIVSVGKAYLDTRQALADLGFDDGKCASAGVRVYKPALVWPLEPQALRAAVRDVPTVLVVEEKRPVVEDQLKVAIYGRGSQRIFGKRSPEGACLLPAFGELNPTKVRDALMTVLRACGIADGETEARYAHFAALKNRVETVGGAEISRPAFFCAGCPHNTGTRIPDGSSTMGATGCHALPAYMPDAATMRPMTMGAEGMPFLGVSHLVELPHMFANMGDGTYAHSGLLAIRAAIAAGVNLTYKILYNDAVAMTGGQPVEGSPSPYAIAAQVKAEGAAPVVVVYDPAEAFDPNLLPRGVEAFERDQMEAVQKRFRNVKGVSVIIYVQTCAAEKRRRRKRKTFPDPDRRVFINPTVCEGCGDCSVQSNCIAIAPLETEFGRKRQIDQSACNKDFSCVKGFCPSFVTLEGATLAKRQRAREDFQAEAAKLPLPAPAQLASGSYNVLITGIGGTGVLTVGAVLGMAVHVEGKACSIMDMTGMAQKGGAVSSHVRIADSEDQLFNARLDIGMTHALIGCDLIVSASADVVKTVISDQSMAVLNTDVASTGDFAANPKLDLRAERFGKVLAKALGSVEPARLAASSLALALTGDTIATNMLMLGYAAQSGMLPVSIGAIEQAIRINGTAVDQNLAVFAAGRLAAADPERFSSQMRVTPQQFDDSIDGLIASRIALLEQYQNRYYALSYADFVAGVRATIAAAGVPDSDDFVRAVARTLGKLMAYKDEYEVARLHSASAFQEALAAQFTGKPKLTFHLAPPFLPGIDPATGRPRKRAFGPWMMPAFGMLRRFKFLRGTPFDPFGYTAERRAERRLIADYRALIEQVSACLTPQNLAAATALAEAASEVKGFGPVKEASIAAYEARKAALMQAFEQPLSTPLQECAA